MSIQKKNGKSEMITILALLFSCFMFGYGFKQYMDMPVVHISATSGKCVEVFDSNGKMKWINGCDRMPEKYHRVLVQ